MSVNLPSTVGRRYMFAIHGQRWRDRARRQRFARLARASGHRSSVYTLESLADHEHLLSVFNTLRQSGGVAPGIDGLTYDDFSRSEIAAVLRHVSQTIARHAYRPQPTRRVRIPKGDGRNRELRLATIVDRVIATAVYQAIGPTIERLLLPVCYGFRTGRGSWHMLAAIERAVTVHGHTVLAIDDVRDAFPSVRVADVMADYRRHIGDAGILWLIETILRGHEGAARTVGIDQGCAICPTTLNLCMHHALDLPLNAAGRGSLLWYRYADNLLIAAQSMSDGRAALQQARELLVTAGFALKGENGGPVNLHRQGTRPEILGFRARLSSGRLVYDVGQGAYAGLEQSLTIAHDTEHPSRTAQAVVQGWLCQLGPAVESAGAEIIRQVRLITSRTGFHEIQTMQVETALGVARQGWERIRQTVAQEAAL